MTEAIFFLFIFAPLAALFLLLAWHFCPAMARGIILWGSALFILLMEWPMLSFQIGSEWGTFMIDSPRDTIMPPGMIFATPWALPLYALCTVALFALLLLTLFPPLLRRVLPHASRRILWQSLFCLLSLQMALYMDSFCPLFGKGEVSLSLAASAVLLLVWQASVSSLARYLNRAERQYTRHTSPKTNRSAQNAGNHLQVPRESP